MKKLFLFFVSTSLCILVLAQAKLDSSVHLSFKGVPITGTLTEYVAKMKKAGFIHKGTSEGMAILEGEFAAYKNCIVGVSTLKQKDVVSKIGVIFPSRDTWSSLASNYFNLKELLTEKYGQPSESLEEFQSGTPNNDGSKMTMVELGRCKYYTTFETEKGTIQLSIDHDGITSCYVKLGYFDKVNGEGEKKQALEDL